MSDVQTTESHCSFSTGIDGSITAGRGQLDDNGYWEFPCEDCARRANYNLNERRMRDAELSQLRAQLATARADLATAEQEKARLEDTIGTYVTAYKEMTRQRDQSEQAREALQARIEKIDILLTNIEFRGVGGTKLWGTDGALTRLRSILTDAPDGGQG